MQVKAEPGTYIEMPKMFEKEVYFLELKRNLYGEIEEFFYEHLRYGLEQQGLKSSAFDPMPF